MESKLCCALNRYYTCKICSTSQCYECWTRDGRRKHYAEGLDKKAFCPYTNSSGILLGPDGGPYEINYV